MRGWRRLARSLARNGCYATLAASRTASAPWSSRWWRRCLSPYYSGSLFFVKTRMNDAARDTARRFAVGDINMAAAEEEHARAARGLEGRLHRHYQAADAALL